MVSCFGCFADTSSEHPNNHKMATANGSNGTAHKVTSKNIQDFLEGNAAYASSFKHGDKSLPPARKIASELIRWCEYYFLPIM